MADVEFSEETAYKASLKKAVEAVPKKGLMTLPIKLGLAKDETGATIRLFAVWVGAAGHGGLIFLFSLL